MAPVGRGVDQDIVGPGLHAALDDGLEELVFHLVLFKREVVDVDDKPVVPALDRGDDRREVPELVLINFDHPQARVIVLVNQGLDRGGLAGARVAVQKDIVGRAAPDKGLGVLHQLLLLELVAHQVGEHDLVGVVDGQELHARALVADAEGPVEAEHAHAIGPVEVRHQGEHGVAVGGGGQFPAQGLDLLADGPVVVLLQLHQGMVVGDGGEAVDAQIPLQGREVVVEQPVEDLQIGLGEVVHRPLPCPDPLGGQGEGVLVGDQDKGQIVLPEIFIEAVAGGEIQQGLDLHVDPVDQRGPVTAPGLPIPIDLCQFQEDTVLTQIAVEQQL